MIKACLKFSRAAGLCKYFRHNGTMKSAKQTSGNILPYQGVWYHFTVMLLLTAEK